MLAPRSWIAEYVNLNSGISDEEIAAGLVRVGFEVEEIISKGSDLNGPLVVGEVLSIEQVEGQKKPIRYVGVNCGESETRYVICGAQNFEVGDLVVVALPGALLPGDFAIAARQTYGHTSNGMICSAREIGLGEDHAGIIVLPSGVAKPGDDAISLLQIKDTVFDIAVNPDRGYALSIRGIAREVAASLNLEFSDPIEFAKQISFNESGSPVAAKISDGAMVMFLRTISDYNPGANSPLWMTRRIEKCGMRAISLAVDVTNYVMMELGQPLHAFDADQVKGFLEIRRAGESKTLKTLDGVERALNADDLVVADSKNVLALAGTMGGLDSEITETTTRIAVEAVRFDQISIAKNSRRHKLSTEASRRFERGVDPSLAEFASARAAALLVELSNATYVGTSTQGEATYLPVVELDPAYIGARIGFEILPETVKEKLELVGCDVEVKGGKFYVDPPSWRVELQSPADLTEEVARNIGYDKIPSILPPRKNVAELTPSQKRRRLLAQSLVARGYAEVMTFPFVNEEVVSRMGFVGARAESYRLANPMSEDQPLMRPHLLPGLLDAARRNYGRGFKDFSIFEMGLIFRKSIDLAPGIFPAVGKRPSDEVISSIFSSVPTQLSFICGVQVGKVGTESWKGKARAYEWTDAVGEVETILRQMNLSWEIKRADLAPWHPGRCAEFIVDGKPVAHAGELHPRVVADFGLPARSAAWGINLDALPLSPLVTPQPIVVMPAAVQDVALVVDIQVSAQDIKAALVEGAGELLESITLFDRYEALGDGKVSLAFSLVFRSVDRTLTAAEVSEFRESAVAVASLKFGATVRA
ncbi:MAG: phenylalanine--tRNA ligase subunit beta [Actinomycetes bacterium]